MSVGLKVVNLAGVMVLKSAVWTVELLDVTMVVK